MVLWVVQLWVVGPVVVQEGEHLVLEERQEEDQQV